MGGSSKSSSSNQQITTNQQTVNTRTIGIENADTAIVDSNVHLSSTDHGAIEAGRDLAELGLDAASDLSDSAFGFAGETIQQMGRTTEAAFDFSRDFSSDVLEDTRGTITETLDRALSFAESERERSGDAVNSAIGALGRAITQAGDATRSDGADTLRRIGIPLVIVIGVAVVAIAWRARARS